MIHLLKDLAVKHIGVPNCIFENVHDLTFTRVEFHFPVLFPGFHVFLWFCCRVSESFLLSTVKCIAVSSAKRPTCEWTFSGMSFM